MKLVAVAVVATDAVVLAARLADQITDASYRLAAIGAGLVTAGWMLRKAVKVGRQWARVVLVLLGDGDKNPGIHERLARGEVHFAAQDEGLADVRGQVKTVQEDVARIDQRFEVMAEADAYRIKDALNRPTAVGEQRTPVDRRDRPPAA